ncbi:PAS domain S-box protein [Sinimarinibacterium flocculans]|uniref:PAS domain S-box protein n=1 Tax=Sinimarinibacterium flocculans TaxID=985250 RepID=UPI003516A4D2
MTASATTRSAELQLQIQHRLVEQLSQQERQYRELVELLEEIVFQCDGRGRLQFTNPSWLVKLGHGSADTLGRSLVDFAADDGSRERIASAFGSPTGGGPRDGHEVALVTADDERRHFVLRVHRRDGGWAGSLFDITERRRVELALRRQEQEAQRLSVVASRTDNLVVITDPQGRIQWVNEAFVSRTGYTFADIAGRTPGQMLQGPDTDPATVAHMHRALARGAGFNVEVLNYARDGSPYWVAIDCSPVHDASGRTLQFVAIERDISERKAAQQALHESAERYRQIVETVGDVILRCDAHTTLWFLNPAWTATTGLDVDSSLGRTLYHHVHPDDQELLRTTVTGLESGGTPPPVELRMRSSAGAWRWCELSLRSGGAHYDGDFVGILRDVQRQRDAQQTLRKAKELAEQLSVERTRFVANMSHEIRTPLNAIIGMGELLADSQLNAEQHNLVSTINSAGTSLLALLNDVLDFAKAESGGLELERRPFRLVRPVESAIKLIEPRVIEKGLTLKVCIDPALPSHVCGDEFRAQQVMTNLLSNAVKFTEKGGITIRMLRTATGPEQQPRLRVEVEDTGIGVRPEAYARLFQSFTQADASTTRSYGGTGLGLVICRQICERAGGSIHLAPPGEQPGAVFVVEVPLIEAATPPQRRPLEGVSARVDVHDTAIATCLENALRWSGASVDPASSEWVITDRSDPAHDGVRVTHLNDQLRQILTPGRLLEEHLGADGRATRQTQAPCGYLKVLVVEDNPTNQLLFRRLLARHGCTVDAVDNGARALDALQQQAYDLVLLDMHMPVMDGIDCVRAIRGDRNLLQPRVVAVTAEATAAARERALRAGCDDWVTKPLSPQVLAEVLSEAEMRLGAIDPDACQVAPTDLPFRIELERCTIAAFAELCTGAPPAAAAARVDALRRLLSRAGSDVVRAAVDEAVARNDWAPARLVADRWQRQLTAMSADCVRRQTDTEAT